MMRIEVRMPDPLYEWLRELSYREHMSMNRLAISAIEDLKERMEEEDGEDD